MPAVRRPHLDRLGPPQLALDPMRAGTKCRPYTGAPFAASLADKPRLNVRKPDIIVPSIGRYRDRVAALVVRAIDQDADRAGGSHLAKRDFTGRGSWLTMTA
jgi:hypothetical protein